MQIVSLDHASGWKIYKGNLATQIASSDSPNGFSLEVTDFYFDNDTPNSYILYIDFTLTYDETTQETNFYDEPMYVSPVVYGRTRYRNTFGSPVFVDGDNPAYWAVSQPIGTYILQVAPPRTSLVNPSSYAQSGDFDVAWTNYEWVIQDTLAGGDFDDAQIHYAELAQLVVEWGDGETQSYAINLANGGTPQATFDAPLVDHHFDEPEPELLLVNSFYVIDIYGRKSYSLEFSITPPESDGLTPSFVHPRGTMYAATKDGSNTKIVSMDMDSRLDGVETVSTLVGVKPFGLERDGAGDLYLFGQSGIGSGMFLSNDEGQSFLAKMPAFDTTYKPQASKILHGGIQIVVAKKANKIYCRLSYDSGTSWDDIVEIADATEGMKQLCVQQFSEAGVSKIVITDWATIRVVSDELGIADSWVDES